MRMTKPVSVSLAYFEFLFRAKCVRRNQRILLSLGTKTETARDMSIQACMRAQLAGPVLESLASPAAAAEADGDPGVEIADDGGDRWALLESQVKSCVAFMRKD